MLQVTLISLFIAGVELILKDKIRQLEPNLKAEAAIFSRTTGIIDSHSLMKYYELEAKNNRAQITYKAEVRGIKKVKDGYEVTVLDASNEEFKFRTDIIINCAGLETDNIAKMAGMDVDMEGYRLKYCKGQYFKLPV